MLPGQEEIHHSAPTQDYQRPWPGQFSRGLPTSESLSQILDSPVKNSRWSLDRSQEAVCCQVGQTHLALCKGECMKQGPKQALNAECSVYVCVHWDSPALPSGELRGCHW